MITSSVIAACLVMAGLVLTNEAKSPPAAYLGLTATGVGLALGIITGVVALFWVFA